MLPVEVTDVKFPVEGVVAPTDVPLIVPPESVIVGIVTVPVKVGLAIGAYVEAAPAVVRSVPDVGKVTLVVPVVVNVREFAPDVEKFPPSVIV